MTWVDLLALTALGDPVFDDGHPLACIYDVWPGDLDAHVRATRAGMAFHCGVRS
jgi:predicted deacylase